jgi:elongator complex protein 1
LQYFGDSLTACVVLAGGDIVVVREEPQTGEDRIEIVGSVDAGVSAAKWSPDEDLLAICTKADTFIFMSRSFDGITDVAMTSEDLKASNHVSVGWGKKETQFKGKGAKALRDPTMPERVDEGVLSPKDDGTTRITWRGDGAFVAVCTVEATSRRIIRVYSREGVLDSVSEPVDGLEAALSWRPAGNLIAGVQRLSDRIDVVFFERNGLRHGQFSLRLSQEELATSGRNIQLSWNNDSSVLAVILANSVQLWTMGNYHWYLKQEIFTSQESVMSSQRLIWHPETPLRFMAVDAGTYPHEGFREIKELTMIVDKINAAEYVFSVARSSTAPPNDYGAVAVIDGKDLKLTPLGSANIPPPMALYEVTVPHNISDVAFSSDTSSIVILHLSGIAIYSWEIKSTSSSPPALFGRITFKNTLGNATPQQICFHEEGDILTLHQSETSEPSLRKYGFSKETGRVEEKTAEAVNFSTPLMISSFGQDGMTYPFSQGASGVLQPLSFGQPLVAASFAASFPMFLPWVEIITFLDEKIAFGMSKNGHLYANSRLLVKNCTSFLVTPLHLIFTTTTHLLKFVHIAKIEG